jgi:hypothetical protein
MITIYGIFMTEIKILMFLETLLDYYTLRLRMGLNRFDLTSLL